MDHYQGMGEPPWKGSTLRWNTASQYSLKKGGIETPIQLYIHVGSIKYHWDFTVYNEVAQWHMAKNGMAYKWQIQTYQALLLADFTHVIQGCFFNIGVIISCKLTLWGQDKIDAILQMTFLKAFSWMKMYWFL